MLSEVRAVLLSPLLPKEVRLRLRQQRLDKEAYGRALYVFSVPDIKVTLTKAVDGRRTDHQARRTVYSSRRGARWRPTGHLGWDGARVTAYGAVDRSTSRSVSWEPVAGGFREGFDPVEQFRAGRRPTTSGQCPHRVAAIATVGVAVHHLHRIYFLDEESRELGWIPAIGIPLYEVVRIAEAAGIAYRSYALTVAYTTSARLSPAGLCEALFPRSARRVELSSDRFDRVDSWYNQ